MLKLNKASIQMFMTFRNANLPPHAEKIATRELARLQKMSYYNPEHALIRNYIELIADLPWSVSSSKEVDVSQAKEVSLSEGKAILILLFFLSASLLIVRR